MNLRIERFALGLALVLFGAAPAFAQPQSITLESADASGGPGDVVTVPVDASMMVGAGGLQIIKFAVAFDGTMLEPLGATPGAAIVGWPAEDVAVTLGDGRVDITGLTDTPVAIGEGLFFSLDFRVREGVLDGTSTDFDLVGSAPKDPVLLQGDPVDDESRVKVSTLDGTFTVVGGAICDPGDAIIDGETTVADAVVVLRLVTGLAQAATPVERCNADADADGSITVGDAIVVLRRVVGLAAGRTSTVDAVVARIVRDAHGARLVFDDASAVYGMSFAVDGAVDLALPGDALAVTSEVEGRTRVAVASASALGRGLSVDLPGDDVDDLRVYGADGREIDVRFAGDTPGVRAAATLANYPNPFNPSTTLEFALPAAGEARLELFNARGERVTVLVDGYLPAGAGRVVWNGTDDGGRSVASGVYYAQLLTEDGAVARQRLVLLK